MNKTTITLLVGVSLTLLGTQVVHGRGFGGASHGGGGGGGGFSGGASHGSGGSGFSGGESHGGGGGSGFSGGASRGGGSGFSDSASRGGDGTSGATSRGGYSGGAQRGGGNSGDTDAAAGAAASNRNAPQYSDTQDAAAGAAASNRNAPQYSGTQGAAAGAAASNRNAPQYSGAQGAAAGAAASNRNAPQYSGAQGAAAGAAAANQNAPQYSGAQGAAAGAAAANQNAPQYSGAQGAAAGYAAGKYTTPPVGAAHMALPTDAGCGMPPAGTSTAVSAGYHQSEPVSGSVYAARGATVRTSYSGSGMFDQGWYAAHPDAWNPTGWTAGQAWGAATWPSVDAWYGFGGAQPIYYDYGNNVSYQGSQVYFENQPVATADQYYQQASTIAQSQPATDPNSGEWMPLGVFGLVKGADSDPHYVMQLAANKLGAVAGNYYDVVTGTTVPVQGAVDKQSQRLAWTVGKNQTTVGETGVYNLTKDEAPALIHIGKDKTQQWTLVRLKKPEQGGTQ
jgi:hypothetical protein